MKHSFVTAKGAQHLTEAVESYGNSSEKNVMAHTFFATVLERSAPPETRPWTRVDSP